MLSIARWTPLGKTWVAEDFNDAARLWLHLCALAEGEDQAYRGQNYRLEVRLSGFPRSRARVVREALESHSRGLPGVVVQTANPDTLVAAWTKRLRKRAFPRGLGFDLVSHPEFEGLVVEVRFSVGRRPLTSTTDQGWTLVVVGEMKFEAFAVCSVWGGLASTSALGISDAPTPWENSLLAAIEELRLTGMVEDVMKGALQHPPGADRVSRMLHPPFGRPRLAGLALRLALFGLGAIGTAALAAPLAWGGWNDELRWLFWTVMAAAVGWMALFRLFWLGEYPMLVGTYRKMKEAYESQYEQADRYAPLDPEKVPHFLEDIAVRKYTADLRDAGFLHIADVAALPTDRATTIYRVFRAPDGITLLALACGLQFGTNRQRGRYWPALVRYECQTFFPNGSRVDSLNDTEHPTRAKEANAKSWLLAYPQAIGPLELYELHKEAVENYTLDTNQIPLKPERLDVYIRRQETISADECRGYADRPYSWRDHLRWYLQLDVKPSPESK